MLPDRGGLADSPELPPDVSRVEDTACPCAEDKILIAPLRSGDEPFPACPFSWAWSASTAISGRLRAIA